MAPIELSDDDYSRLLEFRTGLRTFLKWSSDRAGKAGLAPAQHQLLLAIRGHEGDPTVGEVAGYLLVKAHTAAELASRAEEAGLISKLADDEDLRIVRLRLTARGARKLRSITEATFEELTRLKPQLKGLWSGLDDEG